MICFYLVVLIIRRDVVAWYTHVVRYTGERRRREVLLVIFFFFDFFLYDLLLWRYPRACLLDCLVGCLFLIHWEAGENGVTKFPLSDYQATCVS